MAGFIFDLARLLAGSTAASLRLRVDGPPLARAEIMAVTTILDIISLEPVASPTAASEDQGWTALERQARLECDLVRQVRARGRVSAR